MGCPVGVLQENMSAREFTEWMAFWNTDPSPDVKRQHESANLCFIIAKANSAKSNNLKPKDFLMDYSKGTRPKIAKTEDVVLKLKAWKARLDSLKK